MALPEADISDWVAAANRNQTGDTTWNLDGTEYEVPGEVLEVGNEFLDFQSTATTNENTLSNTTSTLEDQGLLSTDPEDQIFPGTVSDDLSGWILTAAPEEFYVGAVNKRVGNERVFSTAAAAERARQIAIDAEQLAADEFPDFHDEHFPDDYDPVVAGPGRYARDVVDQSVFDSWRDEYGIDQPFSPSHEVAKQIHAVVANMDTYPGDEGIDIAQGSDDQGGIVVIYGDIDVDASTIEQAAADLASLFEDSLETLKSEHTANWNEYFGYTDISFEVQDEPPAR